MCGIAGMVGVSGETVDETVLVAMCDRLAHRGPDDNAVFSRGPVGLAHTRLSIVDVSPTGHQPFVEGRHALVFNGEIYNYKRERRDLEQLGARFVGTSDTEVLFRSLIARGVPETLRRIQGMFAFAYFDGDAVYLARDRLGIKPLLYAERRGRWFFASEAKALAGPIDLRPDPVRTLFAVVTPPDISHRRTPFADVEQVPPGHYVVLKPGAPREVLRYYGVVDDVDPALYRELDAMPAPAAVARFDDLLTESVHSMLMSDVPLGVFVSGGIDSSLIASIAVRQQPDVTLFTANVVGKHSEVDDARALAGSLGHPLREAEFRPERFVEDWATCTYHYESPIIRHPHAIPFAAVARLARTTGVKPVLTGEGADELFLGHAWQTAARFLPLLRWPKTVLDRVYGLVPGLRETVFPEPGKSHAEFLSRIVNGFEEPDSLRGALDAFSFLEPRAAREQAKTITALRGNLLSLLHRNDRMGMLASIESRFPFLDEAVIRFGVNLPVQHKLRRTWRLHDRKHPFLVDKAIVRGLGERYLPARHVTKRKSGFLLYGHQYVRVRPGAFLDGYVSELLQLVPAAEEQLVARSSRFQVARLAAVEIFGRLFGRRESVADVDRWVRKSLVLDVEH